MASWSHVWIVVVVRDQPPPHRADPPPGLTSHCHDKDRLRSPFGNMSFQWIGRVSVGSAVFLRGTTAEVTERILGASVGSWAFLPLFVLSPQVSREWNKFASVTFSGFRQSQQNTASWAHGWKMSGFVKSCCRFHCHCATNLNPCLSFRLPPPQFSTALFGNYVAAKLTCAFVCIEKPKRFVLSLHLTWMDLRSLQNSSRPNHIQPNFAANHVEVTFKHDPSGNSDQGKSQKNHSAFSKWIKMSVPAKQSFFVLFFFFCLFRPNATVSRIGLMESRLCRCHGGPPPPPWLTPPPCDGWLGRSASTLTKRTCFPGHHWVQPGWIEIFEATNRRKRRGDFLFWCNRQVQAEEEKTKETRNSDDKYMNDQQFNKVNEKISQTTSAFYWSKPVDRLCCDFRVCTWYTCTRMHICMAFNR